MLVQELTHALARGFVVQELVQVSPSSRSYSPRWFASRRKLQRKCSDLALSRHICTFPKHCMQPGTSLRPGPSQGHSTLPWSCTSDGNADHHQPSHNQCQDPTSMMLVQEWEVEELTHAL